MIRPSDNLSTRMAAILLAGLAMVLSLVVWLLVVPAFRGQGGTLDMPLPREALAIAEALEGATPNEQDRILRAVNNSVVTAYVLPDFPPSGRREVGPPPGPLGPLFKGYADALSDREFRIDLRRGYWLSYFRDGVAQGWPVRMSVRLHGGKVLVVERKPSRVVRTFIIRALLLFCGIIAVLAGVLVLTVRQTARPVSNLAAAVRRFATAMDGPDLTPLGPREIRDLSSDFNDMKRRIRDLVDQRTRLLAAVAHDMRTYMTRLRLRIEFIEDADHREWAERDIAEMALLLDDTLIFARDDAAPPPPEHFDIGQALLAVVEARPSTDEHLEFTPAEEALPFYGSLRSVRRMVENLIDNAVRYGGAAWVCAWRDADRIFIEVADRGPGIPEGDMPRMLEPFERLEPSRGRSLGGAGLGLSIVTALAVSQGGALELRNRSGGGLLATLKLPIRHE